MPFRFRLETLLRVRQRMLEMAEMELAKAIEKHKTLVKEKKMAENLLQQQRNELSELMRQGILSADFNMRTQIIANMEEDLKRLQDGVKRAELEVIQARAELKQRHMDLELVKGLKERQFNKYLEEEGKRIQSELDELVSLKHARMRSKAQ